jgi:hypothetical protein
MLAMVLGKIGKYREFVGIYPVSEGKPLHLASEKYPDGFEVQFYDPSRRWIAVVIGFVSYHEDTIADFVDVWFLESPELPTDEMLNEVFGETLADYRDDPSLLDYVKMGIYVYSKEPPRRWKVSYYDHKPEPDWSRDPEVDWPVDPAEYAYEFQVS